MNQKFDLEKAKLGLEQAKSKARKLIENPEEAKAVLAKAVKKAEQAKGPLHQLWEELQLMFCLIRDWMKGTYRQVSLGTVVAIFGALLYFISPVDLIPDFIPGLGYIDDVFVIGLVIKQVRDDLQTYKQWRDGKVS
ncbi:MAG TPA: YkvA family protein [Desulfobacteria bacterium]|nr:YkvA family protein [Desulfobacteria bacterium]